MRMWILAAIVAVATLVGCVQSEGLVGQDASVDAPADADPQAHADWLMWRTFDSEMESYVATHGMTRAWRDWVWFAGALRSGQLPRDNPLYGPFVRARRPAPEGQTWKLLFVYEEGRDPDAIYSPPYPGATFQEREQEHFRVIGEMLQEVYTERWHFQLHSAGLGNEIPEEEADVVVTLGYTGAFSQSAGKHLKLIFDGALPHELLHQLGLRHHYCQWPESPEQAAECPLRVPDEGPCMMSRDGELLGPLEQFLLRVEYGNRADSTQQVKERAMQLAQHQKPR